MICNTSCEESTKVHRLKLSKMEVQEETKELQSERGATQGKFNRKVLNKE